MSIVSRTREWVNRIRTEELGLPALSVMPRGIRNSEERCPIARALSEGIEIDPETQSLYVSVDGNEARVYIEKANTDVYDYDTLDRELVMVTLPDFAKAFVEQFDAGKIEKLVEV